MKVLIRNLKPLLLRTLHAYLKDRAHDVGDLDETLELNEIELKTLPALVTAVRFLSEDYGGVE